MEPESQLSRSQVRYSCQLNSIHTLTPYFLKIHFNIILRNNRWCPKWYLSFGIPSKFLCLCISQHRNRALCPAHLIIFDLITLIMYSVKSKNDEALNYAMFSVPLLLPSRRFKIIFLALCFRTPSQSMLFTYGAGPCNNANKNDSYDYSSVYFNLEVLIYETGI
jgi:hypothetical protein